MILPTKLAIPPLRPSSVWRQRLLDRMNRGFISKGSFVRRLTLVTAPAGFGKTTLVRQWLEQIEITRLWLSLEQEDDDLHRFFRYLTAALSHIELAGRSTEGLLAAPQMVPPRSLAISFLQDIASAGETFLLVLDDYHFLLQSDIQEAMSFIVEHLPDNCHMVITARAQPNLPLARYLARGQVMEISEPDLRFTNPESVEFLQETMGLSLESDVAEALQERTEGWAAGLQLAAVILQSQENTREKSVGPVKNYSVSFGGQDRLVADYLMDEVLASLPPERINFLYYTSIVERLNGSLADALTLRSDGERELENLLDLNLFILPLDNIGRWYRYHSLFAELLHYRLEQSKPDLLPKLHSRAVEWFADNDYYDQAIQHAFLAGDSVRAAELIELVGRSMLFRGEVAGLHRWLQNFSREFIVSRPDLLSIEFATRLIVEVMISDPESTDAELVRAIDLVTNSDWPEEEKDRLTGELLAHRMATAASYRKNEEALSLGMQAREYAHSDNLFLLAYLHMGLGFIYQISSRLDEATSAFRASVEYATQLNIQMIRLNSLNGLAEIYEIQGRLSQAKQTHRQALSLATGKSGVQSPVASIAYLGLAKVARERNELESANLFLDKSLRLSRLSAFAGVELDAIITRALVMRAGQEWIAAQQAIDEAEAMVRSRGDIELLKRIGAFATRIWLAQNEIAKAIQWARSNQLTVDDPVIDFLEIEYLSLARILLAEKEAPAIIYLLDRWQPAAEKARRQARLIEMMLLRGLAYQEQDDNEKATIAMARALKMAAPEGFVRTFADEGPAAEQLLTETIQRFSGQWPVSMKEYSRNLAAVMAAESEKTPSAERSSTLVEPLSEREIQILRLIAAGLSNQEIAGELYLTVGTVKTYTYHLYGKLGVNRRAQAVEKGRQLGII